MKQAAGFTSSQYNIYCHIFHLTSIDTVSFKYSGTYAQLKTLRPGLFCSFFDAAHFVCQESAHNRECRAGLEDQFGAEQASSQTYFYYFFIIVVAVV